MLKTSLWKLKVISPQLKKYTANTPSIPQAKFRQVTRTTFQLLPSRSRQSPNFWLTCTRVFQKFFAITTQPAGHYATPLSLKKKKRQREVLPHRLRKGVLRLIIIKPKYNVGYTRSIQKKSYFSFYKRITGGQ